MFDFPAPFRSLVGSVPSSFHPFVLPFLPTSMYLFSPSSFNTFLPSSLDPFIHFSFVPAPIHPFFPSPFHPLAPSSFHVFFPQPFIDPPLHPFFPSSLGALNPGPAACAERLNIFPFFVLVIFAKLVKNTVFDKCKMEKCFSCEFGDEFCKILRIIVDHQQCYEKLLTHFSKGRLAE